MSNVIDFINEDSKLKQMDKGKRGLSDSSKRNYNIVFTDIYNLFGFTPSLLLKQAKADEKPVKTDYGYDVLDLDDRKVTEIELEYIDYLDEKGNSESTKKLKISLFHSFLKHFHIERPTAVKIRLKKSRVRDDEIPTWEDVHTALTLTKSPRDKAIITFAVSSGIRVSDIAKFKICDLITACDIYFKEDEEKTLENLLKKKPLDIVPCWDFEAMKTVNNSNLTITFNTPEATYYIFEYLKDRIKSDEKKGKEKIDNDEALFKSQRGNHLNSTSISNAFLKLNKRMGGEKDRNGHYGKFRIHNLRTLFKTTCRRNLPNVTIQSNKTFEGDLVSLFTGHNTKDNPLSYVYESLERDNPESYIRKTYHALIPYLTIRPMKTIEFKPEDVQKLEAQIKEQKVTTQRLLDEKDKEFKEKLDKKDNELNKLRKKLSEVMKKVNDISNENNISKIQDYIINKELVNQYDLSSKIIELYRTDIENNDSIIVTTSYIETLITRAYNIKMINGDIPNGLKIEPEIYNNEMYKKIKYEIEQEYDYIMQGNFQLSELQSKKIKSSLKEYADEIWLNKEKIDPMEVNKIIMDIIKNG